MILPRITSYNVCYTKLLRDNPEALKSGAFWFYRRLGFRAALDGNSAVIRCERESSDGAGAYPITPSTQMGEYWAEAAADGPGPMAYDFAWARALSG